MFPSSFDPEIYKSYEDLKEFDLKNLIDHYQIFGKKEGRYCSSIRKREDLLSLIEDSKTLKIENSIKFTNYYCVKSKKFMEKEYEKEVLDFSKIDIKYKFIVNDSDINYEKDLITHLNEIYNILEEGGYYILIIPDKRYSFSHFIKESDITDILEDYYIKKEKHSIKSLIEHRCYTTHNNPIKHWNRIHGDKRLDNDNFFINYTLKDYLDSNSNKIVHNYHFTSESFKEIFTKLVSLELTKFKIDEIYPAIINSKEFFVVLKK